MGASIRLPDPSLHQMQRKTVQENEIPLDACRRLQVVPKGGKMRKNKNTTSLSEAERPRVIVCGGRDFTDRAFVFRKLDTLLSKLKDPILVTGGQRGADKLADDWASRKVGMMRKVFHPDKEKHGVPACFFVRNQEMADFAAERRPSFCIAFPGGSGTADMVRRAKKAGLIVREIKR